MDESVRDGDFRGLREPLRNLLAWRRDVRRFRPDPLPPDTLASLLDAVALAPSVGLSQPARFVHLRSAEARGRIRANFAEANARALSGYCGERAALYASLKLSGLDEAPLQLAVFVDPDPAQGDGLGRSTLPQTVRDSAVIAIHTFWLAARADGIGVGWVSILDAAQARRDLEAPPHWEWVAYLCVGYPESFSLVPELERSGWERRRRLQVLDR